MTVDAVTVDDWGAFFAAQLGAAATLGGLVFVGLSINLAKILAAPALPNRALLALAILLSILLVSSYMLIPGQTIAAIGGQILTTGIAFLAFGAAVEIHTLRSLEIRNQRLFVGNMVLLAFAILPYVVGGAMILFDDLNGLYWVAAGVIISFVKAVADAWVLLVEINR